jgi:Tol biopolymer transport system component
MLDPASPADARLVSRTPDTAMATGERAVSPTWRPDGLAMAFALNKTGPFNLFVRTEANDPEPLNQSPWNQTPTSWSPDASRLAFTEFHPRTGADIWIMDVATRLRRPFVRTPFDETGARYSPDGRWIAYLTNEAGRWDAVIRSALDGNLRARIPAARLVPDGRALSSSGRELRVVLAWFAELTRVMREPA